MVCRVKKQKQQEQKRYLSMSPSGVESVHAHPQLFS